MPFLLPSLLHAHSILMWFIPEPDSFSSSPGSCQYVCLVNGENQCNAQAPRHDSFLAHTGSQGALAVSLKTPSHGTANALHTWCKNQTQRKEEREGEMKGKGNSTAEDANELPQNKTKLLNSN